MGNAPTDDAPASAAGGLEGQQCTAGIECTAADPLGLQQLAADLERMGIPRAVFWRWLGRPQPASTPARPAWRRVIEGGGGNGQRLR